MPKSLPKPRICSISWNSLFRENMSMPSSSLPNENMSIPSSSLPNGNMSIPCPVCSKTNSVSPCLRCGADLQSLFDLQLRSQGLLKQAKSLFAEGALAEAEKKALASWRVKRSMDAALCLGLLHLMRGDEVGGCRWLRRSGVAGCGDRESLPIQGPALRDGRSAQESQSITIG